MNKGEEVFFTLLRAGLWEQGVRLLPFGAIVFDDVYRIADEQSVVGLVAAGLEHVEDMRIKKPDALPFLKSVFAKEGRYDAMNRFIGEIFRRFSSAGIRVVLLKGQGVAQCYVRPQWRTAGDIDLLVSRSDYEKAKRVLSPAANEGSIKENIRTLEFCITIDGWTVEIHGSLDCRLSDRMDKVLGRIQDSCCEEGGVRVWKNDGQDIILPSADNDVLVVFTHIVKHFLRGGIGLRQICDWCRLLWTYREVIDRDRLAAFLREMRLLTEWKAFAAFAVSYLGMPVDAMPLYKASSRWNWAARRIKTDILREGNFGHNRDYSYYEKYPFLVYKTISLWGHLRDAVRHSALFPVDSWRVFFKVFFRGMDVAVNGMERVYRTGDIGGQ